MIGKITYGDHTAINNPPCDGARRVWQFSRAIGWLMPEVDDSRQQPKSLAFRMLEARNALRIGHRHTPARNKTLRFERFGNGGAVVFDGDKCIGTVLPTVPVENLGYGIQSWSIPQ